MNEITSFDKLNGNLFQELNKAPSLTLRLGTLHERLAQTVPAVDRIACTLYDAESDRLKTFFNSTRRGRAITCYEFPLSNSRSLSRLASNGEARLIGNIPAVIRGGSPHSSWLLEQGYHTSFTVPIGLPEKL